MDTVEEIKDAIKALNKAHATLRVVIVLVGTKIAQVEQIIQDAERKAQDEKRN